MQNPSLDLMEFIERNILPRYAAFDKAHQMKHVTHVVRASVKLANQLGADVDMAYAIAAYHDLGLEGPRAIHHITSGKILITDARLKKWFSAQKLKLMKEAVEDHRASASHAPRSIYGRIIAEADREISEDSVFRRTVQFGLEHYPEKSREEHWERFSEHMQNKYSTNGYITLWIPNSPNEKSLKLIRDIIAQPQLLRQEFEKYYDEETAKASTPNDNNPT